MEWLFGRRMSPDEQLKKNQRALTKVNLDVMLVMMLLLMLLLVLVLTNMTSQAMRELDRERVKMEQQEKKLIMDIKKMAKAGQMDAVKIMAKVH